MKETHNTFMARFDDLGPWRKWRVELAYILAKDAHRSLKRRDGTRYFEHCRGVALILWDELGVRAEPVIMAGLLHDVVEDTKYLTVEKLNFAFGYWVADLVNAVTKRPVEGDEAYWLTLEKHASKSPKAERWAIVLKGADRLHNVRDTPTKKKVRETWEKFWPLLKKVVTETEPTSDLGRSSRLVMELLGRELRTRWPDLVPEGEK